MKLFDNKISKALYTQSLNFFRKNRKYELSKLYCVEDLIQSTDRGTKQLHKKIHSSYILLSNRTRTCYLTWKQDCVYAPKPPKYANQNFARRHGHEYVSILFIELYFFVD